MSMTRVPDPSLFPPSVVQHTVRFRVDRHPPLPVNSEFESIVLPDFLARTVRKRQIEFLAGRYCAREALRCCVPEHADTPIGVGPNREPLWPSGIVGAITHTADFASVAVARISDARALGLDCERIMDEATAREVQDSLARPAELQALLRVTGWSVRELLTMVFSAKESLFKALYPQVCRYFDFLDVSLEEVDSVRGIFRGRLWTTLAPDLPVGHPVEGRFERRAGEICTAVMLPP
ncbi:4'-phosphopantetheinyl transferase superfamily protein [Sinorhizobium meliloti]|nr:4'-phosphopantetheinyl transferase superfamily protein [Sinorhizobium meliloti]